MWLILLLASIVLIVLILVDSFETTILPRRVTHNYRYARFFYRTSWSLWRRLAIHISSARWRGAFLSFFGPLSLLALLTTWVIGLILAFGCLNWSLDTAVKVSDSNTGFMTYAYWSGTTFFTLGYGDVVPVHTIGRLLAVVEAGIGFGFLALIIGYVPVIYQAFSRREITISLLDARAGSPPSAAQLLLRAAKASNIQAIGPFLVEWEHWAGELLESHLSFPVLSYYRSQHDNQSWLASLTAVLDTCAFLMIDMRGQHSYQAQLTFAMARHAVVDLALIFKMPPMACAVDRLPANRLTTLRQQLRDAGIVLQENHDVHAKLADVRAMYEPFVNGLARYFLLALPEFAPESVRPDNWQTSAWAPRAPAIGSFPTAAAGESHF